MMKRKFEKVLESFQKCPNDSDLRSLVSRSRDKKFTAELAVELFSLCVSEKQRESVFTVFRKKMMTEAHLLRFLAATIDGGRPMSDHWVRKAEARFRKKYPQVAERLLLETTQQVA